MARIRTTIEIEDAHLETVMRRYGLRTKTEAVDLALRHLAGQPMTRQEALAMHGARAIAEPLADVAPLVGGSTDQHEQDTDRGEATDVMGVAIDMPSR